MIRLEIECPYCEKVMVHNLVHVKNIESPSELEALRVLVDQLTAELEELKESGD